MGRANRGWDRQWPPLLDRNFCVKPEREALKSVPAKEPVQACGAPLVALHSYPGEGAKRPLSSRCLHQLPDSPRVPLRLRWAGTTGLHCQCLPSRRVWPRTGGGAWLKNSQNLQMQKNLPENWNSSVTDFWLISLRMVKY